MLKGKLATEIKTYVIITFGCILYSLAWVAFLIPAEITGGGISGVGATIFYATGIPVGYTYFGINCILLVLAWKILGASFGVKTIFSMSFMSFMLAFMQEFIKDPIIQDTFLATVLGGILGGVGLGIVFTQGGSTGGTDIIALIINKYRNISPGRIMMLCDVLIISSSWFVFQSLEKLVYGFVQMGVVAYAIDAVLNGAKQSTQIFIFSKRHEEIADYIVHQTNRGLTVLDGTGWYTKQDVKIIMTVVRKRETSSIFRMIKQLDPDAFISMGNVMGVYGQGFEKIKY
ncbi:YitT family protein [Puteibacter caeruleilacunae]|nr:YitT family protein [Puteibacter caeruleilacunae]